MSRTSLSNIGCAIDALCKMYNPKLHFHFTGIGGSGMAGLAELLLNLGFRVSGSDLKFSDVCKRLARLGAAVYEGHAPEHVPRDASLLVYSSAVPLDNVEILEAKQRGLPVVRRAEVLAELMRLKYGVAVAGSHGKTTTTSMIGAVLEQGGLDPTVVIGGQLMSLGSGSRLGKGDYLVAESDESDGSFLLLKPTIAVVTNIDTEHLNAYGSLEELKKSFANFVKAVPFYGLAVLCVDDPPVRELAQQSGFRKMTYGLSVDAEIRAVDIVQEKSMSRFVVLKNDAPLCQINLPLPGRHMIVNSLAAVAVGLEFGLDGALLAQALNGFCGVKRRLEVIGQRKGITVMSDYGHHPSEIRATLAAIRQSWGRELRRLLVVFQPHRYTRSRDCRDQFVTAFQDCDELFMSAIYPAGEEPIAGISGEWLYEALDHPQKSYVPVLEEVVPLLKKRVQSGDLILCLGAGSIGALPELVLEALEV